jgi:prolipoprotein diacylglyceryltransferase
MLLYGTKRFLIEFLRGDEMGQFGTMFTISQWISAAIVVGGLILWAWLAAARRGAPGLSGRVVRHRAVAGRS